MRWKEHPIADSVSKCQTWNPKSSGASSFDYIDLSSVDKDTKSISSTERYECSDAPSRARQLVEADDVLVATVRPNLNGVALVNGDHHGMTASTGFCVLRPDKDKLDSRFLFHWVKTDVFVRRMVDVATGANYPAVSDAKVKASNVPLPPLPDQKRIARILDAADALRAKRREALAQLDTLLQSTFLDMFADPVTNPMEWQEQSLGDLTQSGFRNGLSPSTKGTVDGEVLTLSAITRGRFDFAARKSARFDKQPPPSQRLRTDTFLICRGNGNKQLVGAGAYPDRSSSRVCFPDTMISVMVDSDAILPAYLENVWRSWRVRCQIERGARTTNGTHKINQRLLSSVVFPVPPTDIQLRFAGIAESIEEQAASQRAHLAELDTLFASLQSRAFQGTL